MKIQIFSPRILSLAILAASLAEARSAPFSTTTPGAAAPPVTPAMPPAGQGTPPVPGATVPSNFPKPPGTPNGGTPSAGVNNGVNNGVNFGSIPVPPVGNAPEPVLPSGPAPNTSTAFGSPAPKPQLTDPNAAAVPPTFYTSTNGFAAPLTNGFAQPMTNGFAAPLTNGFGTMKK